jgi:putative glutathione S-transferase
MARVGEQVFELGREVGDDGSFRRQQSAFRDRIEAPVAGRYHLYVALACPWSHRVVLGRALLGLEDAISISYADPFRDARGWAFGGGDYVDELNGFRLLAEAYELTAPGFDGRVTVPVLWDKEERRIVNNESGDILRALELDFAPLLGTGERDLYPEPLRAEIDAVNEWVYDDVNNGVYKAGFARSQRAYDRAYERLFAALERLERRLGESRYLVGDAPTEADWRLFPTLVRFDSVYYSHFKCNARRIVDYPNLWGYTRDLYQQPRVAETVALDQIKRHYYTTHDMLNPSRIIPRGPELDFRAPHGRD